MIKFIKRIAAFIWLIIGPFVMAVWGFLVSLFVSLREILVTGAVLFGVFVVANLTATWAESEQIGLLTLAALFTGLAKFCAISLTVWIVGIAVSFPNTIGKFINKDFDETFWELSGKARFFVTLGVAGFLTIIATLCFLL